MTSHDLGAAGDFPPHVLRDYALVADGERGALVGPRGDFAWLCAPRWDSGAVFSCLIGGAGVAGRPPCSPRNSTPASISCAATCRRRSWMR